MAGAMSKSTKSSSSVKDGVNPTEKTMDLDDVLVNELGQFGRFQLLTILLVAVPMIMSPFANDYIFTAADIPHRCRIPECDLPGSDAVYYPDWIQNAVPKIGTGFSSCARFAPIAQNNITHQQCPADLFNTTATIECSNYVYAKNNTIVYDFDLGCQGWLRALAGTLNSLGTLLALPITGYVSDRYGRRMALVISICCLGLFGLIRAFSVNYHMYLILQTLQTTFGSGIFSTAYIFATEFVGPKYRMAAGATCSSMFATGQIILGGVAWLVQPWRHLTMALYIPALLLISYHWILPESVRWLLSKQRYQEAMLVLNKVTRVNKKMISEKSMNDLMSPSLTSITDETPANNRGLFATIVRSPILLRRVCTTPIWWITTTFVYYGLSINSTSLSSSVYLNYILTSCMEIPGFITAYFVVNRVGRKPTLSCGYFLCAACNIAFAFTPRDMNLLRLILYLLGKYGIAIVFTSLYLFTSELYPTEYRHTLLAFSSMVGRVGSIVAPLTPVLTQYWDGIPSTLFGSLGLLAGLLILTQPETLGNKLPDTLADAEALGQGNRRTKETR